MNYEKFLHSKITVVQRYGFSPDPARLSPDDFPHQRDLINFQHPGGSSR